MREGLRKTDRIYETTTGERYHSPSLEAQIADLSDEITYYSHDLDDALNFEILSPEQLEETRFGGEAIVMSLTRIPGSTNLSCTN